MPKKLTYEIVSSWFMWWRPHLQQCDSVLSGRILPTFGRNVSPSNSGPYQPAYLISSFSNLRLQFYPEVRFRTYLRNGTKLISHYVTSRTSRQPCSSCKYNLHVLIAEPEYKMILIYVEGITH